MHLYWLYSAVIIIPHWDSDTMLLSWGATAPVVPRALHASAMTRCRKSEILSDTYVT